MRRIINWFKSKFSKNFKRKIERAKTHGAVLTALNNSSVQRKTRCNHRKGGWAASGIVSGTGDDRSFALIKHTFHWGETWLRCLRCGHWWKPGHPDYDTMLKAPNSNIASTSIQFTGVDMEAIKELTVNS